MWASELHFNWLWQVWLTNDPPHPTSRLSASTVNWKLAPIFFPHQHPRPLPPRCLPRSVIEMAVLSMPIVALVMMMRRVVLRPWGHGMDGVWQSVLSPPRRRLRAGGRGRCWQGWLAGSSAPGLVSGMHGMHMACSKQMKPFRFFLPFSESSFKCEIFISLYSELEFETYVYLYIYIYI